MAFEAARAAKAAYMKKYRENPANKKRQNELHRKWAKANPDKVRAAQEAYWQRVAEQREKDKGVE
jgi:hypothetical protein